MIITELRAGDMAKVVEWRNATHGVLRTPFMLTREMQEQFYKDVICNRNSDTRFFACRVKGYGEPEKLIAQFGLNNISWENSNAEISIIIDPAYAKKGFGTRLVKYAIEYGFDELGLTNIYGEVYGCNSATVFWGKLVDKFNGTCTTLPQRKLHKGVLWDSMYFNFNKNDWKRGIDSNG